MKDLDLKKMFVTKEEQEVKTLMIDADKALSITGELARKCLSYPDFKIFRESYERTERTIVDSLIIYTKNFVESPNGDITKYALTNVRMLTRLQDLRHLLRLVENAAKKKEAPKEDKKNA